MHQPSVVVLLEVSRGRIEEEKYFPINTIEGNMSLLETKTNDVKDSNPLREEKHTMTFVPAEMEEETGDIGVFLRLSIDYQTTMNERMELFKRDVGREKE